MNSGLRQEERSPFYPPRARWHTRAFVSPAERLCRELKIGKLLSGNISFFELILSLVFPGYSLLQQGRRLPGMLVAMAYGLSSIVFVVALGYGVSSIAFGLMMSLHTISIVVLERLWLGKEPLKIRLIASIFTMIVVTALVYFPAIHFVEGHWLMPLRIGNKIVVVKRTAPTALRRQDWTAFQISADRASQSNAQNIRVGEGFGIHPVLALPGDHVRFEPGKILVNGEPRPAFRGMPDSGDLILPEKVWFIWPALDITGHGNVSEAQISAAFERLAMVPEDEIVGKAFKSWFWRKQSL